MRVMVFVKATQDTEAGVMPGEKLIREMTAFNEKLVKAGVLLSGEGLAASARGARVSFSGADRSVKPGPFSETKQLVAGYWIWRVKSLEEAIDWAKQCPNPTGDHSELEIRPILEMEDFSEASPELKAKERDLREKVARGGGDR